MVDIHLSLATALRIIEATSLGNVLIFYSNSDTVVLNVQPLVFQYFEYLNYVLYE